MSDLTMKDRKRCEPVLLAFSTSSPATVEERAVILRVQLGQPLRALDENIEDVREVNVETTLPPTSTVWVQVLPLS